MIQHVWERCCRAAGIDGVVVATDDERIHKACASFGAQVVMTSPECPSGTHRVAQAVRESLTCDAVVNVQGDEPGIEPRTVSMVAGALTNPDVTISTAVCPLRSDDELHDPNVVKAVVTESQRALYFSRAAVPHVRDPKSRSDDLHYRHLGVYGYHRKTLLDLADLPPSRLEIAESLEQLRWLAAGYAVHCVVTGTPSIGVDTPADLKQVERQLRSER